MYNIIWQAISVSYKRLQSSITRDTSIQPGEKWSRIFVLAALLDFLHQPPGGSAYLPWCPSLPGDNESLLQGGLGPPGGCGQRAGG